MKLARSFHNLRDASEAPLRWRKMLAAVWLVLTFLAQYAVCGLLLSPSRPWTSPSHAPRAAAPVTMKPSCAQGPVVVVGASGYIGRAVVRELVERGRSVVAFVRPGLDVPGELAGATVVRGDALQDEGGHLSRAIANSAGVISCISSRSGAPDEVWQVDYGASKLALDLVIEKAAPGTPYVFLSAICVKTPVLHLHRAHRISVLALNLTYEIATHASLAPRTSHFCTVHRI